MSTAVRFNPELLEKLETEADKRRISVNALITQAAERLVIGARIEIVGAHLRWDENGTCHTDAKGFIEGCGIEYFRSPQRKWLCLHEKENPECPSPQMEGLIVSHPSAAAFGWPSASDPPVPEYAKPDEPTPRFKKGPK